MKLIVSNSNFSKMPDETLWGSSSFNAISVYFVQVGQDGDAVRHFTMENRGATVGVATIKYLFGIEQRKDMVGVGKPIGLATVKFARGFGASVDAPLVQDFDVYSRISKKSQKVVQYLRTQPGDAVETGDAW